MKLILTLLVLMSPLVHAGNLLIPTCDLNKNNDAFKKLTSSQISEKAAVHVKRMDNCDAASALLELYHRGLSPKSKKTALESLFNSLKNGKFLNEYTALLMGLQDEVGSLNLEKISEDHARLYLNVIVGEGLKPKSQFVVNGENLTLMDEAEINFRLFIQNFPNNALVGKLSEKIKDLHDVKLKASIDYLKYYDKASPGEAVATIEFEDLAATLMKTEDSKYYNEGLYELMKVSVLTSYSSEEKRVIQNKIFEILGKTKQGDKVIRNIEKKLNIYEPVPALTTKLTLKELIHTSKAKRLSLKGDDSLDNFLKQKGNDSTVFIPLDDQFKLKASQVLVGLGVVGVLIAFDEPINKFILRNKDAGILDEVANFGNHFGETSGLAPLILGTLSVGLVFDNDNAKNAAIATIGALALNQLVVETMKYTINRSRPEVGAGAHDFKGVGAGGETRASFPSGHSAAAWTVATIFAQEFGDQYKWAPYVAYTVAAMTSYARLNKDKHWASDVVLGAMIGYVSGRVMHKVFKKVLKGKAENLIIIPIIGEEVGVRFVLTEKVYADLKQWPLDSFYSYQKFVQNALGKDSSGLDSIYEEVYL